MEQKRSELIKRDDAILAVAHIDYSCAPCAGVISAIMNIPQAEPERARWVRKSGKWHCDRCDGVAPKGYRYNYCPDCGAEMEPYGGDNGNND